MEQKVSYTRAQIIQNDFQIITEECSIMWIGRRRLNGKVCAWQFYLIRDTDLKKLQGVLTKCVFES